MKRISAAEVSTHALSPVSIWRRKLCDLCFVDMNVVFGSCDHVTDDGATVDGVSDPGRVARQLIDLSAGESGDRQRAGHLNEFDVYPMLFEQSGVARDEDIQKRNAKSGVGHAHLLGVLCQKGRAILQQDENADRDTDSSVELSR